VTEPQQKPGRSRQDYSTPPEFLEAVRKRLNIEDFDCDLAASFENAVTPRHYTRHEDALVQPWTIGRGWNWLNPPFSGIGPWVKKAWGQSTLFGVSTAVLIPAAVGSNWWREWVHQKAVVLFLNPRLTFVGCKDPYPKDCALLLYSPAPYYAAKQYEVWTWKPSRSAATESAKGRREDPVATSQAR
jgi:phage N-6-adenine-methyltransferase